MLEGTAAPVDTGVLATLTRSELDQQITTARAYPRSIRRFKSDCRDLVTLSESVAKECFYAVPRDGTVIQGPSARLAEVVLHAWGNVHSAARVIGEDGDYIVAQGVVWDLENNNKRVVEVRRRIVNKYGRRFSADMIQTTANAACSIALRNAAFGVVPKALWNDVYEEAKKVVVGDSSTLETRRAAMVAHFQKAGVTVERILSTVGVPGLEDIGTEELLVLHGIANAIREGELTLDAAFPGAKPEEVKPATGLDTLRATLEAVRAPKGATPPPPPAAVETKPAEAPEKPAEAPAADPAATAPARPKRGKGSGEQAPQPLSDEERTDAQRTLV